MDIGFLVEYELKLERNCIYDIGAGVEALFWDIKGKTGSNLLGLAGINSSISSITLLQDMRRVEVTPVSSVTGSLWSINPAAQQWTVAFGFSLYISV